MLHMPAEAVIVDVQNGYTDVRLAIRHESEGKYVDLFQDNDHVTVSLFDLQSFCNAKCIEILAAEE